MSECMGYFIIGALIGSTLTTLWDARKLRKLLQELKEKKYHEN